jgi:glycosyltransferase involved in cell wall biosynthesis
MTGFHFHTLLIAREIGGASHIALHLARFLRDQDEQSHVWLPGPGAAWTEAERLRISVNRFDSQEALRGSRWRSALAAWRLSRLLARRGPGLIHVHAPFVYGHLQRGLRSSGFQRVVHVHLDEAEEGWRWAFKNPPELIITCARFLEGKVRQTLPERAQEAVTVAAVPNAVDTDRFFPGNASAAKRAVGATPGVPLALMLANLAPHKGQETAIRAAAALKARGREVHFWLAGTERQGSSAFTLRLEHLIADLGVSDRVRLLGQRNDAPGLLRAADVFLLPSTQEGLPLSVLEAQATGVPVLAAPTAGVPEVVDDGRTGFLLAADDVEGYATRIEQVLDNPGVTRGLQDAALEQVKASHTWPRYCQRIWDLYQEVTVGMGTAVPAGRHSKCKTARAERVVT